MRHTDHVLDDVLVARVRASMGRVVSRPGAVQVLASQGRVTLRGTIPKNEAHALLTQVLHTRGLLGVDDQLQRGHAHASEGGRDGRDKRRSSQWWILQDRWPPGFRLLMTAGAGALVAFGLRHHGRASRPLAMLGAIAAARALTDRPLKRLIGFGAGRRAVDVQKTITIGAPVEQVFAQWTNLEAFPRIMAHVRDVKQVAEGRFRWVVDGVMGACPPSGTRCSRNLSRTRSSRGRACGARRSRTRG